MLVKWQLVVHLDAQIFFHVFDFQLLTLPIIVLHVIAVLWVVLPEVHDTALADVESQLPFVWPVREPVKVPLQLCSIVVRGCFAAHLGFVSKYICICVTLVTTSGKSLMKMTNRIGPSTLPCGIPLITSDHSELHEPLIDTLCNLSRMKSIIHAL